MSVLDQRPSWLEPMSDPKSELILRAAFDVFEEHGLHCATMHEVARRARVSKETLYARFDSKEGLFYALLAWGARHGEIEAGQILAETKGDAVAILRGFAEAMLRAMTRPESIAVYRMAMGETGRDPELGRSFNQLSCGKMDGPLSDAFEALRASGVIEQAAFEDYADALMGLLRGNYYQELLTGVRPLPSDDEVSARAQTCVDRWLKLFGARPNIHAIAAE